MRLGDFELTVVSDGTFRVDGGAMFGVVPKVLWSRLVECDDRNRIELALNCLLVDTGENLVLVETGVGNKLSEKLQAIYSKSLSVNLIRSLEKSGIKPEDIDKVILTHLHFDHCGGGTRFGSKGEIVPTFPNAEYVIQKDEWEIATNPTEIDENAYPQENILSLRDYANLRLIEGDTTICDGVEGVVVKGHTLNFQIVKISSKNKTAVFVSDLIPTTNHMRAHYNTAFDLYPEDIIRNKLSFLDEAYRKRWLVFWYHDPKIPYSYVGKNERGEYIPVQ